MGWNIIAVDAPASQVRVNFEDIPDDVREGVEDMFSQLAVNQRGVVAYLDTEDRNKARAEIRAYCEKRPAGRLTASIWAGYTDKEESGVFRAKPKTPAEGEQEDVPALSLAFTAYVKKEKGSANGQTS